MPQKIDRLNEERFSFLESKSGFVQILFHGKVVTKLSPVEGERFLAKVESLDQKGRQLLMAKLTGHFKHGNEKTSRRRTEF